MDNVEPTVEPEVHEEPRAAPVDRESSNKSDLKWAVSLLLLVILGLSGAYNSAWQRPAEGREDIGGLVNTMLGPDRLVFQLQLVGVLLVAALVGAIVLAFRDPPAGEDEGVH